MNSNPQNQNGMAQRGIPLARLVSLYRRANKASCKAARPLNEATRLEEEMFGTNRCEENFDHLIDFVDYGCGSITMKDVKETWEDFI